MTRLTHTVGILLGGLLLAACGGGGGGSPQAPPDDEPAEARLSATADCDALGDALRSDARRKIEVQAEELRRSGWLYVDGVVPPASTSTPAAAPTPAAADGGVPPRDHTDTNVQVPGIDEPDVVETDGTRIYLLHENALLILEAFPPAATRLAETVALEGYPLGMFVDGGRALVLSQVYDSGELGGSDGCATIDAPFPGIELVDPPIGGVVPPFRPSCPAAFVKLTLLDLTAAPARIARELYVEGQYVGARRSGERVRAIVQRDWGLPPGVPEPWQFLVSPAPPSSEAEFRARVDEWQQQALAALEAGTIGDWLPRRRERRAGALVDRPLACERAYVTDAAVAEHGTTVLVGLDIASDDAPLTDALLMGRASAVYANAETLVLAEPEWEQATMEGVGVRTALHVFALPADSLATVYRGSGFVPGTVLSQFALDAKDDVLRVATTFTRETLETVTRLSTARVQDGKLVVIGSTVEMASNERLVGVRYLGDRAYLVTFRRIDPLFVIDLHDPAHPTLLGEVELPGFSEYLHPLGDRHLLTIGQAGAPSGELLGAALRIFDVSDPSAPRLTAEHLLPNDGWTRAASDHLAFTFDARLGLLALPFDHGFQSRATLMLVAVDPEEGFTPRGEIEHGGESIVPCLPPFEAEGCPVYRSMLRGLFIEDTVYSISTAELRAHALADLATPLATVELP